uniref:C-type lectin domain-containing protein n=1 Tax=Poecilia latipinna TaxID=48699 RepID=A0A3B3UXZ4_9TELE
KVCSLCLHLSALIVSLSSGGRAAAFHCLNVLHPTETNCWRKIIHLTAKMQWSLILLFLMEVKKVMESTSSKSFIGLFRDTWRWSDGSSFSFRHWNNDFKNVEHIRDQCAVAVFYGKGRWKNVNCAERKPFICYDGEFLLK